MLVAFGLARLGRSSCVTALIIISCLLTFWRADSVFAYESRSIFSLATNFGAAEPFPSRIGLTTQVDLGRAFRYVAGFGFSNSKNVQVRTVGIGLKYYPLQFNLRNNYLWRPVVGIAYSRLRVEGGEIYGMSDSRSVTALDVGVELVTPLFLDLGIGVMSPLNPAGKSGPYARMIFKF